MNMLKWHVNVKHCSLWILNTIRKGELYVQVKLTFQVPVVVGPKSATPPVTPTRCTPPPYTRTPPPIPPHVPLRIPLTPVRPPSPHERTGQKKPDLVYRTTGENRANLAALLSRYMFAVMYLTFSGQSENSRVSTINLIPRWEHCSAQVFCLPARNAFWSVFLQSLLGFLDNLDNREQILPRWDDVYVYAYSYFTQSCPKCSASIHSAQHCHLIRDFLLHIIELFWGDIQSKF